MYASIKAFNYHNFHSDKGEFYKTNLATHELELPTSCPICHTTLVPDILASIQFDGETPKQYKLFSLDYCSHCENCFITVHVFDEADFVYKLKNSYPVLPIPEKFSSNIEKLSPNFVKIFNESKTAEDNGLYNICGMGYRKSLEFLVKDYIIFFNPEAKEDVEKCLLSTCIKKYIHNGRLSSLATASAWLGNDETHYVRKHEKYGIKELKQYIKAFVTYIDSELAVKDAEDLIR